MTVCDDFDLAEDLLKGFTRSAIRTKVLLSLRDGELTAGDLERSLGTRASTILHTVKDMIEAGTVVRTLRGYRLTNAGRIQALMLSRLLSAIVVLENYRDFWMTHDISAIPDDLLVDIGLLRDGEIVSGDPAAILRTQQIFVSQLISSRSIYGVSPIIIPEYPTAIDTAVKNGAHVELVLTAPIVEIVVRDYREILENLLKKENFELYRLDADVRAAFTVIDSSLSLGLFRLDGGYDIGQDLICTGPGAREWGMRLFMHHKKRAERVTSI